MVSHDEKAGCTTVSHLETVDCKDPASVAALLERAARQRAVGATASNERSSRSHMVFTLSVRGTRGSDGQQLNGEFCQPHSSVAAEVSYKATSAFDGFFS